MDRGTSFRTASPLSTYSAGRPHGWLQGANRSDPLQTGQQVTLGQSNNNGQYAEGFIRRPFDLLETYTRAPTSASAVSFDYPSSIAQKQQTTRSVPPLFYDYSEQFQQELDHSMTTAHNVSQALGTVSNGQMHYLSKLSQGLAPNEVASIDSSMAQSRKTKTRGSDQADHMTTRAMSRAGSNEDVGFMAMESLDLETKDTKVGSTVAGRRLSLERPVSGLGSVECSESMPQQPPDHMGNPVVLRSNSRSQDLLAAAPRRAVTESIEFRHDPSGSSDEYRDSVHCFNRESRRFQPDLSNAPHVRRSLHSGRQLSEPDDDAPKFSFESERGYLKRLSRQSGHTVSSSFSRQRSPTVPLCESHELKHSSIHAPVPRRSLSSPSNRDRFNGILSIEEGPNELDDFTTVSKDGSGLSLSIASTDTRQSMLIGGRALSDHQIAASRHISPKLNGIAEITISEPNVNVKTSAASDCQCSSGMPHGAEAQDNMAVQQSPLTWGKAVDVVTHGMKKTETHSFQGQTASIQSTPAMKLHSVPPSDTAEHGHWALTSQKVPLQTMKELPPLPRNSVVSVAPPESRNMGSLPFSFTALRHGDKEETDSVTELGKLAASYLDHLDRVGTENPTGLLKDALEARLDENSSPTRPSSRPWNSEENYPWNNQEQQLEIALPVRVPPDVDALVLTKAPRFTLKLHRSSTSTTRAVKITKPRPSNESSVREQFSTVSALSETIRCSRRTDTLSQRQRLSTSSDVLQTTSFGRLRRPKPLINNSPGQNNSSRTSPTPLNTRFVESFDLPTHDFAIQTSPSLNLVPPSPGLNLEARSFFSDDSSQMQPKGSLRKRFSQLKATVTRASTSDDAKDGGRALLGSAVGKPWVNGRNSQQNERSQQVIRDSHPDDSTRWRFVDKVKAWFAHLVARKGHIEHGASTGIR